MDMILSLIPKPAFTLDNIVCRFTKSTTAFFNPIQRPKDVYNQPVYFLTTEIPIWEPEHFGNDKYFSLWGGFPVENCLLLLHKE